MIRWMSTVRIAAGKAVPATAFAKDIVEFGKKHKAAAQARVYADSFGEAGTIRFFADYDDLAAFEAASNQILADEAYWKKIEEAKDLFIEGSNRTVIMREI